MLDHNAATLLAPMSDFDKEYARLTKLKAISIQNFHENYYKSLALLHPSLLSKPVKQVIEERQQEDESNTANSHENANSTKTKEEIEAEIKNLKKKLAEMSKSSSK